MLNFLNLMMVLWVYEVEEGMMSETNSKMVEREKNTREKEQVREMRQYVKKVNPDWFKELVLQTTLKISVQLEIISK